MALTKSRKQELVKELEQALQGMLSLVFVNFRGLNVMAETLLRRTLREKGVTYKVFRKTLLKKALASKATGEMPPLEGEVAIAYSATDPISSAREIYNFQKTHQGLLPILGGIFEGKFIGAAQMIELATIPGKEVLLSKLAFLLRSPMQRLAIGISEVTKRK